MSLFLTRQVTEYMRSSQKRARHLSVNSTISPPALAAPSTTASRGVIVTLRRTSMRDAAPYVLVYKTCLFFVVRFLVPFAALAFFNQRLVGAMRASDRIRQRSARHSVSGGKERQHTRTLVVVVVVFVVCELPDLTLRAWIALRGSSPCSTRMAWPRLGLQDRCDELNSSFICIFEMSSCSK